VARLVRSSWKRPFGYEIGGRPGLQAFLDTLHRVYDARGVLTDENGRDLLTNEDRSDLVRRARRRVSTRFSAPAIPPWRAPPTTAATGSSSSCRACVGSWFLLPEHIFRDGRRHAAVLLAGVVPDQPGAQAGEGGGTVRPRRSFGAGRNRRDELGQLARTFDRMADRIETLLTAERRLLLDISHELRSPLARLGVAVELARSGDDTDAALNRIQKESDRLNSLVGQLLQVTRAEGDPASLRRDPVRLDELVQQLVEDSAIEAAAHGCSLKYQKRRAGDGRRRSRAAAPRGGERDPQRHPLRAARYGVEVSLARNNGKAVVECAGPWARACRKRRLPRLFDAFYRVESDRDRPAAASGWASPSRAAPSNSTKHAICFSSGLAVVTALVQGLEPGDHIIAPDDVYWGLRKVIGEVFGKWGIETSYVDMTNIDDFHAALRPATRLVWIETPSNPLMKVTDLTSIAALARMGGPNILTVCDGTFATPVLQQPLDCGIDMVAHSTTKYLGGHSDVVGGALIARHENYLFERARKSQRYGGSVPAGGPSFPSWCADRRGACPARRPGRERVPPPARRPSPRLPPSRGCWTSGGPLSIRRTAGWRRAARSCAGR
jgi:signal transduction histidine kinase